jgi:hypothetical protein
MPTLAITSLTAFLGWLMVHVLSARRDRLNKKRDLRTKYLIDAYRDIAASSNRGSDPQLHLNLENAVQDVQLLGNRSQLDALGRSIEVSRGEGGLDFSELLEKLRAELRTELNLEPETRKILFLRMR